MSLPPRLARELAELQNSYVFEIVEEPDTVNVIVQGFPLGEGYNKVDTNLLLRLPRSYPDSGPDMFWVDPDVLLSSGQPPQAAEHIETYLSRPWRRFSWHRQPGWNPTVDNMHGQMEFIRRRLKEKK